MSVKRAAKGYTDNDYFKMGAAVAVGELLATGMLRGELPDYEVRNFLASFGLGGFEDFEAIGMGGVYIEDFEGVF